MYWAHSPNRLKFICLFILLFGPTLILPAQNLDALSMSLWTQNAKGLKVTTLPETWIEYTREDWDTVSNSWEPNSRQMVTRDSLLRPSLITHQTYGNQGFETRSRTTNTYPGTSDQWTESLTESWDGSIWENSLRTLVSYDAQGRQTSYLWQFWSNNSWDTLLLTQKTHTYDGNNQLLQTVDEEWNSTLQSFEFQKRTRHSYNSSNEIDTSWADIWNNGGWEPQTRSVDIQWYDFSERKTSDIVFQYFMGGGYVDSLRSTTVYDPNGGFTGTSFIRNSNSWQPNGQSILRRDAQMRRTFTSYAIYNNGWEVYFADSVAFTYNSDLQPLVFIKRGLDLNSQTWTNDRRGTYLYAPVGRPEPVQEKIFALFPQPVVSELFLQTESAKPGEYHLSIYDATGKQATTMNLHLSGGKTLHSLDLKDLVPGLYTYRISGADRYQGGTLIKQ